MLVQGYEFDLVIATAGVTFSIDRSPTRCVGTSENVFNTPPASFRMSQSLTVSSMALVASRWPSSLKEIDVSSDP